MTQLTVGAAQRRLTVGAQQRLVRAMKTMKRVSKIAKGKRPYQAVFRGSKAKTQSGLTKNDLTKNTYGKIVSKKKSDLAKKNYAETIKPWCEAVAKTRKALNLKGFVPVGGKSAQGRMLYAR